MGNPIVDRALEYAQSKGLKAVDFERISGLSNGMLKNLSEKTRHQTFLRISNAFPDLNIEWLRTGDGEMLVDSNGSSRKTPEVSPTVSELIATIGKQADIIKAQQETIRKLSETVRGLTMGAEDKSGLIG